MTDDVSDLVREGNSAVTLLQELFACDITAQCEACGSIESARGSNGSSSKMFPLRWHSYAGGPYTAWPAARNERRALS
jgi:hypothetical protein